jgi:hypothetical protein
MNFQEKLEGSFKAGVATAFLDRGMKKEAVGAVRSLFRPGRTAVRRGPVTPRPNPNLATETSTAASPSWKRHFWNEETNNARPWLSGVATAGSIGGAGLGVNAYGKYQHGQGQIEGAKETMTTAVDSIDEMDNMRKLEFFMSMIGKERPELIEHFKQLIPEDKQKYFQDFA